MPQFTGAAERFFLNDQLLAGRCSCVLDDRALTIAGEQQEPYTLSLEEISFSGFRKATPTDAAAVILCQSARAEASDDEEPASRGAEPAFDDLLLEFAAEDQARLLMNALETALNALSSEPHTESSEDSEAGEEEDDSVDLPVRMAQEQASVEPAF